MDSLAIHTISVFIAFFALYNPISSTAIFFALSSSKDKYERKKIAIKSIYTAFIIISVSCVLGKAVFDFFAIPVSSFQVMGGIFILFIGIQMLIRKQKKTQENDRSLFDNEKDIALYPLAFPLMAGPGAITAAVVFSATDNYMKILINIFSILIISVITYFCFRAIYKVSDKLNNRIIEITTRIMGFIITIVGSGLIVAGLQGSNTY